MLKRFWPVEMEEKSTAKRGGRLGHSEFFFSFPTFLVKNHEFPRQLCKVCGILSECSRRFAHAIENLHLRCLL